MTAARRVRRPVISLHDVWKTYGLGEARVHALRAVTVRIDRGDYVAIMGPSGSGKTTFMNIVSCMDAPTRGRYLLDGYDVTNLEEADLAEIRNHKIGLVFQSFNLLPRLNALENVELPLVYAGVSRSQRRALALDALDAVGLAERVRHRPNELSGGQQQRVAIARAIVGDPPLLLADEPTGNLATTQADEVLDIFAGLNAAGRTVVVITHEPSVGERAKRIVRFSDGRVVDDQRHAARLGPPPPARVGPPIPSIGSRAGGVPA
jgi:putative ABC transport system ATP-binding protein